MENGSMRANQILPFLLSRGNLGQSVSAFNAPGLLDFVLFPNQILVVFRGFELLSRQHQLVEDRISLGHLNNLRRRNGILLIQPGFGASNPVLDFADFGMGRSIPAKKILQSGLKRDEKLPVGGDRLRRFVGVMRVL